MKIKPYYYSDFIIKDIVDRLAAIAMRDSTPKKYASLMFEAAEIINQLMKERGKERGKDEEHHTKGSE